MGNEQSSRPVTTEESGMKDPILWAQCILLGAAGAAIGWLSFVGTSVVDELIAAILTVLGATGGLALGAGGASQRLGLRGLLNTNPVPVSVLIVGIGLGTLVAHHGGGTSSVPLPSSAIEKWTGLGVKRDVTVERLFDLAYPEKD